MRPLHGDAACAAGMVPVQVRENDKIDLARLNADFRQFIDQRPTCAQIVDASLFGDKVIRVSAADFD